MYSRDNQFPQSISLITKTSVYPNLVVPPHLGEKPTNKVREAGKVINNPSVLVPAVLGALAVWIQNQNNKNLFLV